MRTESIVGGGCGGHRRPVAMRSPHGRDEGQHHSGHDDSPRHQFMAFGPGIQRRQLQLAQW